MPAGERRSVALRPEQLQRVTKILNISIESLFDENGQTRRKGGPTGKARRLFDDVSQLPRKRQQRILNVVEDMLTAAKK